MKEFFLASANAHKAEEFSKLFDPLLMVIKPASEKLDVIEDGKSFQENAYKKAEAYYQRFAHPIVSDDSGLVVEALPGELGIHSARFGGDALDDMERCKLLLEKLEIHENRNAYFVCVLCFYLNPREVYFFEGRSLGSIADRVKGESGFGYDPLFMPEGHEGGLSFAEDPDWKMLNSHRFKACKMATQFFERQA